ncbi:MAG: hypothetical protein ACRDQI_06485 [Pseudonocardiaceae bacterium]
MSIKLGNARVGHRVGGFYVSAPVTGRNAGRQVRIGHRLPGGFYGSVPIAATNTRRPKPPISSYSLAVMIATTILLGIPSLLMVVSPAWPLGLIFIVAGVWQWLTWAANPQDRQSC